MVMFSTSETTYSRISLTELNRVFELSEFDEGIFWLGRQGTQSFVVDNYQSGSDRRFLILSDKSYEFFQFNL